MLAGARSISLRHGFVLVGPQPHRFFGADLVGQHWRPPLHRTAE
ncbi:hypothetical protein [Streptomyces beihaiensis]|nr:hypothetical protein [Streptomyces beihaiensis]